MSSEEKETGLSMVKIDKTCSKSIRDAIHQQCSARIKLVIAEPRLTVLHDVSDDSKLVKVSTSSLCSKRFFEGDLDVRDQVLVE